MVILQFLCSTKSQSQMDSQSSWSTSTRTRRITTCVKICELPLSGKVTGTQFRGNFNVARLKKKNRKLLKLRESETETTLTYCGHRRFQTPKCQKRQVIECWAACCQKRPWWITTPIVASDSNVMRQEAALKRALKQTCPFSLSLSSGADVFGWLLTGLCVRFFVLFPKR